MNKIYTSLGTMSGTSIDGIDFSIIQTDGKNYLNIINNHYLEFKEKLRKRIFDIKSKINSTKECQSILKSTEYKELLKDITLLHLDGIQTITTNIRKIPIDLVGLHGITLWHKPKDKYTHQIIDPFLLKKKLNNYSHLKKSNLIFNFRKKDIENGGQGAPLTPIYHQAIMKHLKIAEPRLIVNIGGITNVTYLNKRKIFSTDIGPGNCLIDRWVKKNFNKNFDRDGKISLEGKVNKNIAINYLNKLIESQERRNISYDISEFNLSEFNKLNPKDGAATLSYITARTILNFAKDLDLNTIILCGGGRHNQVILNTLKEGKFKINSIDDLDFGTIGQGDFIESQAFAYLSARSYLNLPISFPTTTGVKMPCTGGDTF